MSSIDRRSYFKRCSAWLAASKLIGNNFSADNNALALTNGNEYNVYFGDLHNHNAVGYGLGSVERAFDIAHSHLDFVSVTPHAYADYTPTSGDDVPEYVRITRNRWPDVLELNKFTFHEADHQNLNKSILRR